MHLPFFDSFSAQTRWLCICGVYEWGPHDTLRFTYDITFLVLVSQNRRYGDRPMGPHMDGSQCIGFDQRNFVIDSIAL